VLIELPIMLMVSWSACSRIVRRLKVPADLPSRLLMGGLAFILLIPAELSLTIPVPERSVASHFAAYRAAPALIGLAGQLAFALMPLAARRPSREAP
jgi:hypothetical protein